MSKKRKIDDEKVSIEGEPQRDFDDQGAVPDIFTIDQIFEFVNLDDLNGLKKVSLNELLMKGEDGDTVLHRCITLEMKKRIPRRNMVEYLLTHAPQLASEKNSAELTPICFAIQFMCSNWSLEEFLMFLIPLYPVDALNIQDSNGKTALHHLILCERDIIKRGFYGDTGYERISTSNFNIMKWIVESGGDINIENLDKLNLLMYMLHTNENIKFIEEVMLDRVRYLIEKDSKLYTNCGIHVLSFVKTYKVCKYILEIDNSKINIIDKSGKTPSYHLMNSIYVNDKDNIAKLLLENGAKVTEDIILETQINKLSFLFVEHFLENNPDYDINTRNKYGNTLLITYSFDINYINKLLKLGADPNIESQVCSTLITAIHSWNIEAVKKLIQFGAIFNTKKMYQYLFTISANYYGVNCIRNDEWLHLFQNLINSEEYQTSELSSNLIKLLQFICIRYYAPKRYEILHIMKSINNNKLLKYNIVLTELPGFSGLRFVNQFCEPLTHILATILKFNNGDFTIQIFELMLCMLDAGFSISQTPSDIITPLTILLTYKVDQTPKFKNCLIKLIKKFIELGVNVESCAINVNDNLSPYNINLLKSLFQLPDVLFLAFINNRMNLIKEFLKYWWAPPSALVLLFHSLTENQFITRLQQFCTYPCIPHGTLMYNLIMDRVTELEASRLFEQLHLDNQMQLEQFTPFFKEALHLEDTPIRLTELCKFSIRKLVSEKASQPGTSLRDILKDLLDPPLRFLLLY